MKSVIIGFATLLISIFVTLSANNLKTYQRYNYDLRFVCEELSATGSLYIDMQAYAEGRLVFNRTEADKAIREQLKELLNTDDALVPTAGSYWQDPIVLKVYYFDDSNTDYMSTRFTDPDTGYSQIILHPTVIVTINAGRGRFFFPLVNAPAIRSAAHELKAY